MLATDAQVNVWPGRTATLHCGAHQLANAVHIDRVKRVARQDATVHILRQELGLRIIAADAKRHLRQIVGAKAEELGHGCQLARLQRATGHLDHGANLVRDLDALGRLHAVSGGAQDGNLVLQLVEDAHQGHHQLGVHASAGLDHVGSSLHDCVGLHLGDGGVHNAKAAAAQAHHGVGLVEALQARVDHLGCAAQLRRHLLAQVGERGALVWQELVQRRVQHAHGDRQAIHGTEDALKVLTLVLLQLLERLGSRRRLKLHGSNHAAHGSNALRRAEEHVLGTGEADALGTIGARHLGVLGRVSVGPHLQAAVGINPAHELGQVASHLRLLDRLLALDDLASGTVEADPVALLEVDRAAVLGVHKHLLVLVVHAQCLAAAHARLAPATGDDRSVAGHAAA
mmetsp:Transcript_69740/g.153830  ORF Transcript_69740/g.153830 Transcript_69740/m.153830 type:complete len:399 (+) Transcript_69740:474-1670(+)